MKSEYAVIMAGGAGTRLWPLSTYKNPKQYHDILNVGRTLIQQTYDNLKKIVSQDSIYVITNFEFINITQKQLPELNINQIITEPLIKNTAASNLYLAKKIHALDPNASLIISPSDHLILNQEKFIQNIRFGLKTSKKKDYLITLGIKPTRPETGYGYIQFIQNNNQILKKVKKFKEKPNLKLAKKFIKSKEFLWNIGVFIWKSSSILKAFQKFKPNMFKIFSNIDTYYNTKYEKSLIKQIYPMISNVSIDYAIMENADNVYVIPSKFGWSDIGTWQSIYENSKKTHHHNFLNSKLIQLYNTKNCIIHANKKKNIIVDGLKNYTVVDTPNALLICPINNSQNIKKYVNKLKQKLSHKNII